MTTRMVLPRFALLVLAVLLRPGIGAANHDELPRPPLSSTTERLGRYDISRNDITVSGLSSGGFFAHQFHIAYSRSVAGAGIVAGGPYGCTEQFPELLGPLPPATNAALYVCTHILGALPRAPSTEASLSFMREALAAHAIDDFAHIRNHRVWLFHGERDEVVPKSVMDALEGLYRALGVKEPNLASFVRKPGQRQANHGMPIEDARNLDLAEVPCEERRSPFVIRCDYEAAGLLLRHLYPAGFEEAVEDAHDAGDLRPFDQTEFFDKNDARASLSHVGYIYVPSSCRAAKCRLHIAFHGCLQNVESVGDDFVRDAGYNRWAAANRIIVLYPQTRAWFADPLFPLDPLNFLANPQACWDFWGYSGFGYHGREGKQMRAVKAMLDHVLGR